MRPHRPLHALYAELNVTFWGGRLPAPERKILYGGPIADRGVYVRRVRARDGMVGLRNGDDYCLGLFLPPGPLTPPRILVLSPLGAEYERRVLLHEMAHTALWIAGFHAENHGPRFVAELERLAGLGEAWALEEARLHARPEAAGLEVLISTSLEREAESAS